MGSVVPIQVRRAACSKCGRRHNGLVARCLQCGAFNTVIWVEAKKNRPGGGAGGKSKAVRVQDVGKKRMARYKTGHGGLDELLGGGIVDRSVVVFGGAPGSGKSTLCMQVACAYSLQEPVIYLSGEETEEQVTDRARRLGVSRDAELYIIHSQVINDVYNAIKAHQPGLVIVDSIQKVRTKSAGGEPGSNSQVAAVIAELYKIAKDPSCDGLMVIAISQVNADGEIKGPLALQHEGDVLLKFFGNDGDRYRMLRCSKNRFGASGGVAVMEMTPKGLTDVSDASGLYLSGRQAGVAGSVVTVVAGETSNPFLVEIQSLTMPVQGDRPKRTSHGMPSQRFTTLSHILTRSSDIDLTDNDVITSVAGGADADDVATDLASAFSIASRIKNISLPELSVVFGEVGLTGEIRPVKRTGQRLLEASKLGFNHAIIPAAGFERSEVPKGMVLTTLVNVDQITDTLEKIGVQPHRTRTKNLPKRR